jgi:uncharacterized RDD family membrane protein YckC
MAQTDQPRVPATTPRPDRRERPLITPEGVDLKLELADASQRAGAFLLDALFIVLTLVAITILAAVTGLSSAGFAGVSGIEIVAIIWLLTFFFLRNFYFIAFELGPRAATPGKRILGLRVASRDGGRLTANAIFARNAMREIEVFLPMSFLLANARNIDGLIVLFGLVWSGIFVFFPLFNRDRLRAGDLVGGTWVVKAPRRRLVRDLALGAAAEGFLFSREQLDAYGVHELHVLEDVLRAAKTATLAAVAARIRAKIGWTRRGGETDQAFLSAYYPALRQRLEARMLLGVRRRDKHDKR